VPPIGESCVAAPPAPDPPLPTGCAHAWLVDADGVAIEGAPSGLVRCPDPTKEGEHVVYRTAAVACPELIGDACLCDVDCARGEACICANEITTSPGLGQYAANRCLPSDCAGASDCDESLCRVDVGPCLGTWFPSALRCASEADDCLFDSDCMGNGSICDYEPVTERFTCDLGEVCE
jgi:hypothetical protein